MLTMGLIPWDAKYLGPRGPPLTSCATVTPAFSAACFSQSYFVLSCPGFGYMQSVFLPSRLPAYCCSLDVCACKGWCSCSRFHRMSSLQRCACTLISMLRIPLGFTCMQVCMHGSGGILLHQVGWKLQVFMSCCGLCRWSWVGRKECSRAQECGILTPVLRRAI